MHQGPVLAVAGAVLGAFALSFVVIYLGVCTVIKDTAPDL